MGAPPRLVGGAVVMVPFEFGEEARLHTRHGYPHGAIAPRPGSPRVVRRRRPRDDDDRPDEAGRGAGAGVRRAARALTSSLSSGCPQGALSPPSRRASHVTAVP